MFDLTGRTVLVTGSSRGLGREIAEVAADLGADVVVNYPTAEQKDDADDVVDRVQSQGRSGIAVRADVSVKREVTALFEEAERALGTVDVVVNNAGIGSAVPIEDLNEATWDRVIDVDLKGVFLCSKEAVGRMDASADDPARIINIASQLVFKGAEGLTHYCAAKGGVVAFTRALAREVAPTITVNAVAPGPMTTPMLLEGTSESWREAKRNEIPLDRFADTADVAPTVAFLASDAGAYYTGQTLSPDGGDAMH